MTSNKIIYIPCSTPQMNTWSSDWIQFYREHRLGYQLKLTLDQYGDGTIYEKGYLAFEIVFLPIILEWFYIIACYILVDTSIIDNLVSQFNSNKCITSIWHGLLPFLVLWLICWKLSPVWSDRLTVPWNWYMSLSLDLLLHL